MPSHAVGPGAITTWADREAVRVILRPLSQTKTHVLHGLSPGMAAADATARGKPWAIVAVTDPESDQAIAVTPGAIGTASLTSILVAGLAINRLSLDGVDPTVAELARGRYRLATDITFVTSPRSPPDALRLVDFACSAEGRAIAERVGVLTTGACRDAR